MNKKELIKEFISGNKIAVAGVSRNTKKFGYIVFKELRSKGFDVIPVNPNLDEIEGIKVYPSLNEIPGDLNFVVAVIHPDQTAEMVKAITRKDIKTIWMQSGSESEEAVELCKSLGISTITKECILMYAEPSGFHKFHRFIAKLLGKAAA